MKKTETPEQLAGRWNYPTSLRFGAGLSVNLTQPCPVIGTVLTLAGVFGDVDCTGAVSSVDALKVLRFVAALPVAQTEPPPCTDLGQVLP